MQLKTHHQLSYTLVLPAVFLVAAVNYFIPVVCSLVLTIALGATNTEILFVNPLSVTNCIASVIVFLVLLTGYKKALNQYQPHVISADFSLFYRTQLFIFIFNFLFIGLALLDIGLHDIFALFMMPFVSVATIACMVVIHLLGLIVVWSAGSFFMKLAVKPNTDQR